MPRSISQEEKSEALRLIKSGNYTQVEIHKITGLSRPYIKKLADSVGFSFKKHLNSTTVICENCTKKFVKYNSIANKTTNFCSIDCLLESRNAK